MTIAGDQLRAFLERIERMEEEKAAIAADIKEIYAEAKGNGYDTKILRQIVRIRKQDQNERQEQEALLDLYMAELGMLPLERYADDDAPAAERAAPLMQRAEVTTSRVNVPACFDVEAGEEVTTPEITEPQSSEAAAQAGRASLPATSSPVESDPVEISTPIQPETAEPSSPSIEGINEPVVMVAADANAGGKDEVGHDDNIESNTGRQPAKAGLRADVEALGSAVETGASNSADEGGAQPVGDQPKYAAPGVVTWERTPPEGVRRHEYSAAFGDSGQVSDGLSQAPIVKVGPAIVDGWYRYNAARAARAEYSVVHGDDLLADVIRWNLADRDMSDAQKRAVAQRLAKLEPDRHDEIFGLVGLEIEVLA